MGSAKKKKLLVCVRGRRCEKLGSQAIYDCLKQALAQCDLEDRYKVKKSGCLGLCKFAPMVKVEPEGVFYGRVDRESVIEIALRHAKKKKPLKKLVLDKKKH